MEHETPGGACALQVKCLMRQLFDGMAYLHENWVLHRDLKTSNILFNNRGELKARAGLEPCLLSAPAPDVTRRGL